MAVLVQDPDQAVPSELPLSEVGAIVYLEESQLQRCDGVFCALVVVRFLITRCVVGCVGPRAIRASFSERSMSSTASATSALVASGGSLRTCDKLL